MPCRFILMLTRHDRTVPEARAVVEEALAAGVLHIGFKDVGLPSSELAGLVEAIRSANGTVYLEMVSPDEPCEEASAQFAVRLGVDHLLGGTRPELVLPIISGRAISYWPFAGRVVGHPSRLVGSREEIVMSARMLAALSGVNGLNLLAYRFVGDAKALIKDVVRSVSKPVLIAGSIDTPERVASVIEGAAAAFTVGTAVFDRAFAPSTSGLAGQIEAIQNAIDATPA
jgi:4-hydroxythreonine-4-phosphate dehydrogenase